MDRIPAAEAEFHGHAVLRALIAAAKADGHIDDRERQLIDELARKMNLDPSFKMELERQVRQAQA